jgi:hypothetical protein
VTKACSLDPEYAKRKIPGLITVPESEIFYMIEHNVSHAKATVEQGLGKISK